MRRPNSLQNQGGVALFTALIVMTLILLIAGTAARFSVSHLKMASNEELRVNANQWAQAIIDAAFLDGANTAVTGDYRVNCTPDFPLDPRTDDACDQYLINLPSDAFDEDIADGYVALRVVRDDLVPPPRGIGTSIRAFDAAPFHLEAIFDKRDERQGFARISEGALLLVPKY